MRHFKSRSRALFWIVVMAVFLCSVQPAYAPWRRDPETGMWINVESLPLESPELQLEHADQFFRKGDYSKAIAEYRQLLRFYPTSNVCDQAQFGIGASYHALRKYPRAVEEYQKVVANYPQSPLFEGVVTKQYEIAEYYYERGLKKYQGFHLWKGSWLKRAIETYKKVIENSPYTKEAAQSQYKIGKCYFTMENYIESQMEFQRVLDQYPNSDWASDAFLGTAECAYKNGLEADYDQTSTKEAISKYELFVSNYPNDPQREDAEAKLKRLKEVAAHHDYLIGMFYERRGKTLAAQIAYEAVQKQYPDTEWAAKAREKGQGKGS